MKLLIAPWGNPKGWKEVTYVFNEKKIKSRTSLKILQEVIKPDKTIIIGLDTLAERGKCYKEVKEDAEKTIKEWADEFELSNYEILIASGIGKFLNGDFKGDALDYYYYIIAEISLKLLENFKNCGNINIHLDLTHGINYSTILTYKAVKEIAGVFSLSKEVLFKAYNADPSLPRITNKLSINVIEDITSVPIPFGEKLSMGRPLEPKNLSHKERRMLFKDELKNVKEISNIELSAFIGALYNGLPLALFSFFPEKDKLKEIILTVLNIYEKYVKVKEGDKLKVVKKVKFGRDFKIYVFTYIIATLLSNLGLVYKRKSEVNLDEIENLKNKLFKFEESLKVIIDKELYKLKTSLEKKEVKEWNVYSKVIRGSSGDVDKRNFLAHSGFEENAIEIKKESDNLLLRYRKDILNTIENYCQSGLK